MFPQSAATAAATQSSLTGCRVIWFSIDWNSHYLHIDSAAIWPDTVGKHTKKESRLCAGLSGLHHQGTPDTRPGEAGWSPGQATKHQVITEIRRNHQEDPVLFHQNRRSKMIHVSRCHLPSAWTDSTHVHKMEGIPGSTLYTPDDIPSRCCLVTNSRRLAA